MNKNEILVVIGGGIAGISCIETLFQYSSLSEHQFSKVILISESNLVKRVTNYCSTGRNLETFDVIEESLDNLGLLIPNGTSFDSIIGSVEYVSHSDRKLVYRSQESKQCTLPYDILCICFGSKPRFLDCANITPECEEKIVVLRDTTTIKSLERKLENCKRLVIVGNGGISLELVAKISKCDKTWIIRDDFIGSVFLDSEAGKFFLNSMESEATNKPNCGIKERVHRTEELSTRSPVKLATNYGPALGPGWSVDAKLQGSSQTPGDVRIIYCDEVKEISCTDKDQHPVKICTSKGVRLDCDLIALAIGVQPNGVNVLGGKLDINPKDGGILVDEEMRTSLDGIYAAGDIVSCEKWPSSDLWFQMRLWTQARQMGCYAAKCILSHIENQDPSIYFNFDCFTHCTSFFGYRVVLLGKFNGQFMDETRHRECEAIVRINPGRDYIKILLLHNKIIGAVLVGNSGLEETIENLIHDGIDVGAFKERLLDDSIDIDDFFD